MLNYLFKYYHFFRVKALILSSSLLNCTLHFSYLKSLYCAHQSFLLLSNYNLVPYDQPLSIHSPPQLFPASENHHSILNFYKINCFRFYTLERSSSTCLSISGLFHLACWSLVPSMLLQEFHPFYGQIVFHCVCTTLFISSSVARHFGCFHFLALVNSAALNMAVQMSL
jgi:hypothetical protein